MQGTSAFVMFDMSSEYNILTQSCRLSDYLLGEKCLQEEIANIISGIISITKPNTLSQIKLMAYNSESR